MTPLEILLTIITVIGGAGLVAWLVARRPPATPIHDVVHDDRPTIAEFTTALSALERSQSAALEAITRETHAGREHVEAIVTQLVNPPSTPVQDRPDVWEGQLDPEVVDDVIREASDAWIGDDEIVDPFTPPAGLPLPPMPGVQPPDNFGGA